MRTRLALFGVVLLVFTTFVNAQTGAIRGTVRDVSGGVLPGAVVEVSGPALDGAKRSTVTDVRGVYAMLGLPAGTYVVRISLPSFTTVVREGIVVSDGAAVTVDAALQVGAVIEAVTVVGEAPTVDVTSARQATTFTGEEIRDLPTARNLSNLMVLTPGLNDQAGALNSAGGACTGGSGTWCTPNVTGFNAPGAGGAPAQGQLRVDGMVLSGALGASEAARRSGESYAPIVENPLYRVAEAPLSTFSIDVDTASYANVRRFLNQGALPPADAVRIEELVNYFRFDYPQPRGGEPFSITTEMTQAPWNPAHRLVLIGLQGRMPRQDLPPRNLVFLIDVSGSMMPPDKLPLVQRALRMLVDTLDARDRVAIVVYAGNSGLVLPPTPGDRKETIHEAIARLQAGGSTNGGAGIQLAYGVAREHFVPDGVNRVVLATDGDFNVGVTRREDLLRLIEEERQSGVFLSVLGVGTGNLRDSTMEMLTSAGNGNYSYLDSIQEARKVLVREAGGTLVTIASDVKIQVEFNPATVSAYRLVGYENRLLAAEDFNDDRKDAGEIGAGHSVTALYEIVPAAGEGGAAPGAGPVDPLRYQPASAPARFPDELMAVKVRYKAPGADRSRLLTATVQNRPREMQPNIGFASAVAEFGLVLRGSAPHAGTGFDALLDRARRFRGEDVEGYRAEFIRLAEAAAGLRGLDDTRASR